MDSYGAFYEEHREKLFSYLIRITGDYYLAGDIMQESFTRYMEYYKQEQRSVSLLYTIARNALVDDSRKQRRNIQVDENKPDGSQDAEQAVMIREEYRDVLFAMQRLEEEERDILALAISGDLSYQDIASIMGISEANVKVRVHRARLKLRTLLHKGNV